MSNDRTFHARDAAKLDDPSRLAYMPPDAAATLLGLKPGMVIADIGAGTGYFSIPFARRIGPLGRVFAVDLQREMLQLLDAKLETSAERGGIELVEGTASETGLPDSSCDLVFLANIWHELDDRESVLAEAARILRTGGRIAILDWRLDVNGPPGPPAEHRVSHAEVESLMTRCRWTVEHSSSFGSYSYLVVAQTPVEDR
jgi:ubiquinone/menaquinone biosynthesis C-methylase UbiE